MSKELLTQSEKLYLAEQALVKNRVYTSLHSMPECNYTVGILKFLMEHTNQKACIITNPLDYKPYHDNSVIEELKKMIDRNVITTVLFLGGPQKTRIETELKKLKEKRKNLNVEYANPEQHRRLTSRTWDKKPTFKQLGYALFDDNMCFEESCALENFAFFSINYKHDIRRLTKRTKKLNLRSGPK